MAGTLASLFVELGLKDKNLKSGISGARRDFKKMGADFKNVGKGMSAAFTLPAIAAAGALLKIGSDHDSMVDTIRIGTGAVGAELKALDQTALSVFSGIPTTMEKVGIAVSELNRLTGATGITLDDLAKTQLELARVTETDLTTNIVATSHAFEQWGVNVNDQSAALDVLFRTTQATGVPVATLADQLAQYGPILRQMGFGIDESTALLGTLGKAGLDAGVVITGLRTAYKQFADEGLTDTNKALQDVFNTIKNSDSDISAGQFAIETFGSKAGPALSEAIRTGKLDYQDLLDTVMNGTDTILDAAAATNDWRENLQILTNRITVKLIPIADRLFAFLNDKGIPALEKIERKVEVLAKWFSVLPKPLKIAAAAFVGLLVAIGPILMIAGTIISSIAPAIPVITALLGAITLPVLAVIGVIVLLAIAWKKNWFDIQGKTKKVIGAILGILSPFIDKFMKATKTIRTGIRMISDAFKKGGIAGALKAIFGDAGQIILKGLGRILGLPARIIGQFLREVRTGFAPLDAIIHNIGAMFQDVGLIIQAIFSGQWRKAFSLGWDLIKRFINQYKLIGELLLGVFRAIPWGTIASALVDGLVIAGTFLVDTGFPWLWEKTKVLFGAFTGAVSEWWSDKAKPWLDELPGKIVKIFDAAKSLLKPAGNALMAGLGDGIIFGWNWLMGWFSGLPSRFAGYFGNAKDLLRGVGNDLIAGMAEGIAWAWNWMMGWLNNLWNQLPTAFRRILESFSPSKVFARLGETIPQGIAVGIKSGIGDVRKEMSNMDLAINPSAGRNGAGNWRLAGVPAAAASSTGNGASKRPIAVYQTINSNDGKKIARELLSYIDMVEQGLA